jgi:transposase InsO family protein
MIEEFGPKIQYIKGSNNLVADALSRLPRVSSCPTEELFAAIQYDPLDDFPVTFAIISKYQMEDREFQSSLISNPDRYDSRMMHHSAVVFQANSERIVIPVGLQHRIIKFYHDNLKHPGVTRTLQTIQQFMVWPKMQPSIEKYVNECGTCQRFKRSTKKYGKLPTKIPVAVPWLEVHVDHIGPYSQSDHPNATKYYALSIIDPATSWVELFPLPNLSSATTCMAFDTQWLCRYPRPYKCIYDQGSTFTSQDFQELLSSYGIVPSPTTVQNPQANSALERIHQVIDNMICTSNLSESLWVDLLPAVAFAIRGTFHTILQATPCQVVFGRDLILDASFTANWSAIVARKLRQTQIDNARENQSRIAHIYAVGDLVLIQLNRRLLPKLARPTDGPYRVVKVNFNGTVVIQRGSYAETINIRRLSPFLAPSTVPLDVGGTMP